MFNVEYIFKVPIYSTTYIYDNYFVNYEVLIITIILCCNNTYVYSLMIFHIIVTISLVQQQ